MEKIYVQFVQELKQNILQSRFIAASAVNREQLILYYKTGKMLSEKAAKEKWGAKVIQQISDDLQKELPGIRGFSFRNLKKMRQFYEAYRRFSIGPSLTAQIQGYENQSIEFGQSATGQIQDFLNISFTHHLLIISRCRSMEERSFCITEAARQYWSMSVLEHHMKSEYYKKRGRLPSNFETTLPAALKPTASEVFTEMYLLEGLDSDSERVIEKSIVSNIEKFILRMGKGFSFIGSQYRIEVDGEEFFIDLLFFNRHLQCLVAFELKSGKFKPAHAGQLNFYLNVLDEKIRLPHENPSIGIVLCKEKSNTIVEFSVKSIDKAMGVATYRTSKQMPDEMKEVLPDTDKLAALL